MVVTGSDYVRFAPILCGWPHSGSCVSRSEGPLENDGAMGIFGLDDFFFFCLFHFLLQVLVLPSHPSIILTEITINQESNRKLSKNQRKEL